MTGPALTKTRTGEAMVQVAAEQWLRSDASWVTDDGYRVHRTLTGGIAYWVQEQNGRFARHLTLCDAKADIDWLRAHGR